MKLFKRTGGCFQDVAQQRFADEHYESHLEEWIYHNPQLIADDLMMIGRQVVTDGLKRMDLLALNSRGHTVIIELKRAENPRDLVGQINEYITAVGKWSERELEKRIGRQPRTLEKAFRERFKSEPPDEFNRHREAVVVVEDIDPDTLETFRRQGIRVVTFSYLKSAEEEYLVVNDLNGGIPVRGPVRGPKSRPRPNRPARLTPEVHPDVVVVAARHAWPEYQQYYAYVCQPDRPFRQVTRIAFYADGQICRLVPLILESHDHVDFLRDKHEGPLGELVITLLEENKRKLGTAYKVMLLSAPDSPDTLKLTHPIRNDLKSKAGKARAFTQNQRYVSSEGLKMASKTSDLVNE